MTVKYGICKSFEKFLDNIRKVLTPYVIVSDYYLSITTTVLNKLFVTFTVKVTSIKSM